LKRGDLVMAVLPGELGKPRPTLVVQSDHLAAFDSIVVCPLTSDLVSEAVTRISLEPTPENGLRLPSQVMVEKVNAISLRRCRDVIGKVDRSTLDQVAGALAFVLGMLDEA
jgi:mRNA interferase MazF